jgi:hypothetical protein
MDDPPQRRPKALAALGPPKFDQHSAPISHKNIQILKSAQASAATARPSCATISPQLDFFDFCPAAFPAPEKIAERRTPALPKAELIPFPLAQRRQLIAKLTAVVGAASTAVVGENLLRGRLARVARGLRIKHFSEAIIAREVQTLESAVRGEIWRRRFGGDARV